MITFNKKTLHEKKIVNRYKIRLFNDEVHDGYSSKEFKRNYKKFQKEAIMFGNGGISTP
jgi:hypothetical protein